MANCISGIFFQFQKIMKMAVKSHKRNHIHMPFPAIGNDFPDLGLGIGLFVIHLRVTIQFDTHFIIEIILVGFPLREEIDLCFYLRHF